MLEELKTHAYKSLSRLSFPSVKEEQWRYVRLAQLSRLLKQWKEAPDSAQTLYSEGNRLSRAPLAHSQFLEDVVSKDMFWSLGVLGGGERFSLKAGAEAEVTLQYKGEGSLCHEIVVGKGSCLHLMEILDPAQGGDGLNVCMRVVLEEGAVVHSSVQQTRHSNCVISYSAEVSVGERGTFYHKAFGVGSPQSLIRVSTVLEGKEAVCDYQQVALAQEDAALAFLNNVHHNASQTQSRQHCKIIGLDSSKSVFQGGIFVKKNIEEVDGLQSCRGIVQGDKAQIYNKPFLEIASDNVRCGHGAAIGGLDPNALFYLTSRGLPQKQAKTVLLKAFFLSLIKEPHWKPLQQTVEEVFQATFQEDALHE